MNITKILSILKYSPYLISIIFIILFFNVKSDKKGLISENKTLTTDLVKASAERDFAQDFANKLQNAATKQDEYYKNLTGKVRREFKPIIETENKLDTIYLPTSPEIKTTFDKFKTNDLELNYAINHTGQLIDINFDYKVKEKTIIERKIIYQDRPVITPVNIPKSFLMINLNAGISGVPMYNFMLHYCNKNNWGISGGIIIHEKKEIPTIGINYKI